MLHQLARIRCVVVLAILTVVGSATAAEPLRVAAAISLREAVQAIAADYEATNGAKVEITLGSSGQLLAQIRNGAPLDVFISAAHEQVDALEHDRLVEPHSRQVVAANELVLIAPAKSAVDLQRIEDLASPALKRLAIGDPQTVPAGMYAQQTLDKLQLTDKLKDRLVYGTNARQVLDYVVRGEVSAGLVFATDARAAGDKVHVVATADPNLHAPIEYPAVMLRNSKQVDAAKRFVAFLRSSKAEAQFSARGFIRPTAASQPSFAPATAPSRALPTNEPRP